MTELQRQKQRDYRLKWRLRDKTKLLEFDKKYREKNAAKLRQKNKELNARIKQKMFDLYGHCCVHCGFSNEKALSLDHVHNDGNIERKNGLKPGVATYRKAIKEHGNWRYQILCMNCQFIKKHTETEL